MTVVLLAFIVRFGFGFFTNSLEAEPLHDENVFIPIAKNLILGNGYTINGEMLTARRVPGYPFLLAGLFFVVGENLAAARVMNILISALTVGTIYLIGYKLFNKNIAFVAALVSAFYLGFIEFSLKIISDTLFVLLITILLLLFIELYEHLDSLKLKLICGGVLGISILTRSELVLFIPFLFIWIFLLYNKQFAPSLRTFVIIIVPTILFIVPWLIRNYIVFDKLMMATNLGRVVWGVYNPETFTNLDLMGGWHPPELGIRNEGDFPREQWDPSYDYLPEREWDQQQIEMALQTIKQNIGLLPRMTIYKFHGLIFTPGAIRNLIRFPLVYLFLFGLILLITSGDKRFFVFYTFILFTVFSTLIFYTNERLRLGLDPVIIVIASYGLFEQVKLVKSHLHTADN